MQLAGDALAGAPLAGFGSVGAAGAVAMNFSGEVLDVLARFDSLEIPARVDVERVPARYRLFEVDE